ncbi:MAG: GNAT family N-acetyltransferase [Lachnospiraceae bacterium]|nr:GNAT family N-acetyltransferase [Lachnospiraceae bacterium]
MDSNYIFRAAVPDDAAQLLEIYAPYVRGTAVTFEYNVPDLDEFRERLVRNLEKYPCIVAEAEGGRIDGYACTGPFRPQSAYAWTAETTIYLRWDAKGQGLGKALYERLERVSRAQNIQILYACIGIAEGEDVNLDNSSPLFHYSMGYRTCGRFRKCGYKFGTWYDMIFMEKALFEGDRPESPEQVKAFPDLTDIDTLL